jgi:hypothetical protein
MAVVPSRHVGSQNLGNESQQEEHQGIEVDEGSVFLAEDSPDQ